MIGFTRRRQETAEMRKCESNACMEDAHVYFVYGIVKPTSLLHSRKKQEDTRKTQTHVYVRIGRLSLP